MSGQTIEIRQSVDPATATEALRILNWFFDERPDLYLVQKPRVVYDSDGNERKTVRYEIRQRAQPEPEKTDQAAGQTQEQAGNTGEPENNQEGESNHEQGTIQQ